MNAIIALCHFCEAHGPRALFCTYSGRGDEDVAAVTPARACAACGSLGADTVLASRATDGTTYYSREDLTSEQLTAMLRQAAIRSLTCEVSWSADGGCVYFSEGPTCHVLSCTFQLSDSRARGLRRWFSTLVLMRDCHQLLDLMPFFSEHMQKSANELQTLTAAVFDSEQRVCPQRALRLNTGRNDFGPTRSLEQLTGEENIFRKLHMTHAWLLDADSRTCTETLYTSGDLLSRLDPRGVAGSIFGDNACTVEESAPLRRIRDLVGEETFRIVLYCVLTGIELVMKLEKVDHADTVRTLARLLPIGAAGDEQSIRAASPAAAAQPTAARCVLCDAQDDIQCRWHGSLPAKCPTLMLMLEGAVNNPKLTDAALHQLVVALKLEWLGIAHALKNAVDAAAPSSVMSELQRALGVATQDRLLVNYWMQTFCI